MLSSKLDKKAIHDVLQELAVRLCSASAFAENFCDRATFCFAYNAANHMLGANGGFSVPEELVRTFLEGKGVQTGGRVCGLKLSPLLLLPYSLVGNYMEYSLKGGSLGLSVGVSFLGALPGLCSLGFSSWRDACDSQIIGMAGRLVDAFCREVCRADGVRRNNLMDNAYLQVTMIPNGGSWILGVVERAFFPSSLYRDGVASSDRCVPGNNSPEFGGAVNRLLGLAEAEGDVCGVYVFSRNASNAKVYCHTNGECSIALY